MNKKIYMSPETVVTVITSKEQVMQCSVSSNVDIDYGGDAGDDIISADSNGNYFGGELW